MTACISMFIQMSQILLCSVAGLIEMRLFFVFCQVYYQRGKFGIRYFASIFFIQGSWTHLNLSVDPWVSIYPRLRTMDLGSLCNRLGCVYICLEFVSQPITLEGSRLFLHVPEISASRIVSCLLTLCHFERCSFVVSLYG